MKRVWLLLWLFICCIYFTVSANSFWQERNDDSLLVTSDSLNPMTDLLKPHVGDMELLNTYSFAAKLPGFNSMALVYDTQARSFTEKTASYGYMPIHSATIVIAVNKSVSYSDRIVDWLSLLESNAVLCIPFYNTEGGRLAAIALARGLGAKDGDISPAIDAYLRLKSENRLNNNEIYRSENRRDLYDIQKLESFDAIILWDYQANALNKISENWDIIIPIEGRLTVNCGILYASNPNTIAAVDKIKQFIASDNGLLAMKEAGFSPIAEHIDLSSWDDSRLLFGPAYRRAILEEKQYSPASIYERLILQSAILLVFCIAAQIILRRFPQGQYRSSSLCMLAFVVLWLLIGIIKTLAFNDAISRYCWFATYIPRHALPVCWYLMCRVACFGRLPSMKWVGILIAIMAVLSAVVLTNDMHNWFFIYQSDIPALWDNLFTYNWGYYASSFWNISLIAAGFALLFYKKKSKKQRRLLVFVTIFVMALIAYQFSYIVGMKYIVDLDIPTTVAIAVLLFVFAAQNERFMGASLLALPVFHNSPYAIAVFDSQKQMAYWNSAIIEIIHSNSKIFNEIDIQDGNTSVVNVGDKIYNLKKYMLSNGKALVLEDITHVKKVEHELEMTRRKLNAVQKILTKQSQDARMSAQRTEQEHYILQMKRLFISKLQELQLWLSVKQEDITQKDAYSVFLHARLLIYICQHRMRFVIKSAEMHSFILTKLIEEYVSGIIKNGNCIGLDGVVTGITGGSCPSKIVLPLLDAIDSVVLHAHALSGSSLVCRIEADENGLLLNALLSLDSPEIISAPQIMLSENIVRLIKNTGGSVYQEIEDDCSLLKVSFRYLEVAS